MNFLLLIACVLYTLINDIFANSPIVTTSLGQVKGSSIFIKEKNRTISLFQGIPYAKSPVGELRFKAAEPADKWEGVFDATHARSPCMQPNRNNISENCLFINIYTPHDKFDAQSKKSVLFWIHGGAYITGTIFDDSFNATYLSLNGDVVVVQVNYRLSAFGFLYDGTKESPGNQALTDQLLALKFVKENIGHFGGDSNSVTIFGESAGSMAVSSLIMMKSQNLFKRAIMQSGSLNSFIGSESKEKAHLRAIDMAKEFKCFDNTTNKIETSCLKKVDAQKIVTYIDKKRNNGDFFSPIYGEELLPIKPSIALENGNFQHDIDLLFGTCNDEGSGFLSGGLIPDLKANSPNSSMSVAKAKLFIQLVFSGMKVSFSKDVVDFYTKGLTDKDGQELKRAVGNAFGDFQITCPAIIFGSEFALKSNRNKIFAYRLTFTTRNDWTGVRHGDDIKYVFGGPLRNPNQYTQDEIRLSETFINIWSTFAKTGNPPSVNGVHWPEAIDKKSIDSSVKYMALNPKSYHIVENAYKETCDGFWRPHLRASLWARSSSPINYKF